MKKVLFGMMVWQVEVLLSVTFTGDAFAEKTAFVTVRPTLCSPAPEKVGVMLCVLAAMGVPSMVHAYVQPSATGSTAAFSEVAVKDRKSTRLNSSHVSESR